MLWLLMTALFRFCLVDIRLDLFQIRLGEWRVENLLRVVSSHLLVFDHAEAGGVCNHDHLVTIHIEGDKDLIFFV